MKYIKFEAPEKCVECPALRNNGFGDFYCFLTDENLSYHNIDVTYKVGDDCPVIEEEE